MSATMKCKYCTKCLKYEEVTKEDVLKGGLIPEELAEPVSGGAKVVCVMKSNMIQCVENNFEYFTPQEGYEEESVESDKVFMAVGKSFSKDDAQDLYEETLKEMSESLNIPKDLFERAYKEFATLKDLDLPKEVFKEEFSKIADRLRVRAMAENMRKSNEIESVSEAEMGRTGFIEILSETKCVAVVNGVPKQLTFKKGEKFQVEILLVITMIPLISALAGFEKVFLVRYNNLIFTTTNDTIKMIIE